jgi:NAD(P)-dependent dehydrogenase (short-subunit alcohol dehydrogenase family)
MFDLSGKRALVTGSSRGIGREIALSLARQGADVCIHYSGDRNEAEAVVTLIHAAGRSACVVEGDLTDTDAPRSIVAAAVQGLGAPIDILVVNAAIQVPQPLADIDPDSARRQFDANLMGTVGLIQNVVPDMKQAGSGRIIHIGSVQQWRPHPDMTIYAALKSGIENMMRNFAVQLAPHGITVNTVSPGVIETERNRRTLTDPAYRARVRERIPIGRIGKPEDCAGVVAMLCSISGDYITGANIPVDGGMSLD